MASINKYAAPEMLVDSIEVLPNEILALIFNMLSLKERLKIELVSPRWHQLSLGLWKTTKEFGFGCCLASGSTRYKLGKFNRFAVKVFIRRCSLEKIIWTAGGTLDGACMPFIAKHCPNLVTLLIDSEPNRIESFDDVMLSLIVQNCRSLRHLIVRNCDHVSTGFIRDANCSLFTLSLPNETKRAKFWFPGIGYKDNLRTKIDLIAEKFTNLIELDISFVECRKLKQIGNLKFLEKLKLHSLCRCFDTHWPCLLPGGRRCERQKRISKIFANKIYLKELDISRCLHNNYLRLDDSKFIKMLSFLPALESLNITNHSSISNKSLDRWFGGGEMIGLRRRDAPLTLFCAGTGIIVHEGFLPHWKFDKN